VHAVGQEGAAGEVTLGLAGEANGGGGLEGGGFVAPPVELFFEVFQRVGASEPRVEHAMGENQVGCAGAAQRAVHGGGVLLKTMHDHGVEIGVVGAQPMAKGGVVAPPQRMERETALAGA
jgi:hypothetical protein